MIAKKLINSLLLSSLVTTIACTSGCTDRAKMAEVTGTVMIDGVPFTTGKVIFNPIAAAGESEAGKSSFGKLDEEGKFMLSTYKQNDGALVGEHRVTIFHSGEDSLYKFTRLTYPGGTFNVISGKTNDFDIDLTAEQVKKFGNSK